MLIVNASTVLHLNATAAEYAYHFVNGTPPEEAAKQIASGYRVSKEMALEEYDDFADRIETLKRKPSKAQVTIRCPRNRKSNRL